MKHRYDERAINNDREDDAADRHGRRRDRNFVRRQGHPDRSGLPDRRQEDGAEQEADRQVYRVRRERPCG